MSKTTGDDKSSPVVGTHDFKGWWIAAWLRSEEIDLPERCACCLGAEDLTPESLALSNRRVSTTTPYVTPTIAFPLCGFCRRHAKADARAVLTALAVGVFGTLAVWGGLLGFWLPTRLGLLGLILVGVVMLLVGGATYAPMSKLAETRESCADPGWPIELDADPLAEAITDTRYERRDDRAVRERVKVYQGKGAIWGIRIRNHEYALEFLRVNGANPDEVLRIEAAT